MLILRLQCMFVVKKQNKETGANLPHFTVINYINYTKFKLYIRISDFTEITIFIHYYIFMYHTFF